MTRDGDVKQRQHFYHHGDTICHRRSIYVTTKLHGTSPVNLSPKSPNLDKIATETLFVGNDSHAHPEQNIKNIDYRMQAKVA